MHNSVMFEFPEDGAFLKEGRYYTLEAASLSLPEKREKKKEKNEEKEENWREREMDKFEGRTREKGWFYAVLDPRLFSTKNSLISIPSHDRY